MKARNNFAFYLLVAVVVVVFGVALAYQQKQMALRRLEIASLNIELGDRGRVVAENERLRAAQIPAGQLEALRADHASVARLRGELEALQRAGEKAEADRKAQAARATMQATISEEQRSWAKAETQRLNKEGSKLVEEYKALVAQKATAEAAQKMAEIQAKQAELQAFKKRNEAAMADADSNSTSAGTMTYSVGTGMAGVADGARIGMTVPLDNLAAVISSYETILGVKITQDAALAAVPSVMGGTKTALTGTRSEIAERLRGVLQERGVMLERAADGTWVAKPVAGR